MDNPKQTIKEIHAQADTSSLKGLVDFLLELPLSQDAAIFYVSLIAMMIGFVASWTAKYAVAKTVDDCLYAYLFTAHFRRTLGVAYTYIVTAVTMIAMGTFENGGAFVGWQNVFTVFITAAMAADGTLNKGTQGAWSTEQRAAERERLATEKEKSP